MSRNTSQYPVTLEEKLQLLEIFSKQVTGDIRPGDLQAYILQLITQDVKEVAAGLRGADRPRLVDAYRRGEYSMRGRAIEAVNAATLPAGYHYGEDALESFKFGISVALEAVMKLHYEAETMFPEAD